MGRKKKETQDAPEHVETIDSTIANIEREFVSMVVTGNAYNEGKRLIGAYKLKDDTACRIFSACKMASDFGIYITKAKIQTMVPSSINVNEFCNRRYSKTQMFETAKKLIENGIG